ncbi:hypothetical protein SAMN02949497_3053 [Methylomagnum ishizawai]|uniref:Uncharacterized protein n=1 Tax=Methylomagnum ishizawai TaxID=1760988 RepID=A0A1Y6CYE1_9GAMM|nr:hypothetical protein [Methylomagnum ishizawai]SMF95679.1 hypothetical protein SAMN02949497_3053 [Methylomagnum ishizawai]
MPRNKTSPDYWPFLVGLNFLLLLIYLAVFLLAVYASIKPAKAYDFPWQDKPAEEPPPPKIQPAPTRDKAPLPPQVQPYKIPRFGGREGDDFRHISPIKLSKEIDADSLFKTVVNCFPERPKWGLEIKAVAGGRYTENNTVSTFDTAGLSRYYAGIVAEMPLYSADEQFRMREQEAKRRGEVAANVAALLKALADRDRALRMIGIGESVEARSQERVQAGIAPAEEQIGYLKEVATAAGDLDAARAAIVAARLALAGQCRDEIYDQVNNYLVEVTR